MEGRRTGARYWIGVASRDHVRRGVEGGFCQLGHGRSAPIKRLSPGDGLVYYSPRTRLEGGDSIQAFTAIGIVGPGDPYLVEVGAFHPTRRPLDYYPEACEASIRPLLQLLHFTKGRDSWGVAFRLGAFEITESDFCTIAEATGVRDRILR